MRVRLQQSREPDKESTECRVTARPACYTEHAARGGAGIAGLDRRFSGIH